MVWQPSRLTAEQQEERRLAAGRILQQGGVSQAEVARRFGVTRAAVGRWAQRLKKTGTLSSLKHHPIPGRASKLTEAQWQEVCRTLDKGAMAAGFPTERWTLSRVAHLIEKRFGVHYHPHYLAEPLRKLGFTPQRPKTRAKERDDALVEAWLKRDWPRIKRGLAAQGEQLPSWTRRAARSALV